MARKIFVLSLSVVIVATFLVINGGRALAVDGGSVFIDPTGGGGGGGGTLTYDQTFTASVNSACSVNFSWKLQTGFAPTTDFTIERDTNSSFTSPEFIPVSKSNTSFVWANSPNITYYFGMKGISSQTGYTLSTPASITTPALPTAPSPVRASVEVSGGNAVVQFDASALPSAYGGYSLTRTVGTGAPQTLYADVAVPISGTTFGYSDPAYSTSNTNTYSVKFFDSAYGCSATERSFSSPLSVVLPALPSGLSATSATSPVSVTLSWMPGAGQMYAEIMKQIGTGAWTTLTTSATNSFTDPAVVVGNTYSYKVRSCSNISGNVGCSDFSSPVTKTISSGSLTTEAMNFKVRTAYVGSSTADVYLEWDNNHPGSGYSIDKGTAGVHSLMSIAASTTPRMALTMANIPVTTNSFQVTIPAAIIVSEEKQLDLNAKARLSGHAWSSSLGWIDMSCDPVESGSCGSGSRYNVFIDNSNVLHGVAWAGANNTHGYSWLSFNQDDLVGCPDGATNPNNCIAKLDTSVTPARVVGWAKFLGATGEGSWGEGWVSLNSVPASTVGTANAKKEFASGWNPFSPRQIWNAFVTEGNFISLHGFAEKIGATVAETGRIMKAYAQSAVDYGLTYSNVNNSLSGVAWGGQVSGWMNFGSNAPTAPVVSNVVLSEGNVADPNRTGSVWCDEDPYYTVKWMYSGSSPQTQAKITFYNGKTGAPYVATTSTAYGQYNLFDPLSVLAPKTSFSVGVQVFDGVAWSTEVRSGTMITPSYYSPLVYFKWNPTPAKTAWPINFSGTSTVDRSGGVSPASGWGWQWVFVNTTSATDPTKPTATVVFNPKTATTTDRTKLTVTDGTNVCSLSQQVIGGVAAQPKKIRGIQEK